MGEQKYLKDIEKLFNDSPVVDAGSIERIIKSKKKVKQYSKQLIRNLVLKGKIKRIFNGYYTLHDEPSLAVFCCTPSYLGLQDALSFHNLWEQETAPVIITARKARQGIRKVFGLNVLVRRIKKKYLFGFDYCKQGNFYFPYSDIEKTFIDMIYFKEELNKETIKNFQKNIDIKKIKSYLKAYPGRINAMVLNALKTQNP